ncbi:MAG TPA: response regulator, partial [Desulfohalobiaceae bacterium]|nr:response regulator [Desulfohalobiaceae bacterium]
SILQLLETTELDTEQQEYVQMGTKSSKRLQNLLSDILDLSRIEADKMEIKEEEIHLIDILQSIKDIFIQQAKNNENTLSINMEENTPNRLLGDGTRLTQILFNLVGNANKYTQKGQIEVNVSNLPGQDPCYPRILFTISDTGKGIPDNMLDEVFESFSQANDSNSPYSRKYEGAGLGLPLVKRLVDLMGGNMSMDSQENKGTIVYVSIPFKFPEALKTNQIEAQDEKSQSNLDGYRILVADDDPTTQFSSKRLLEKMGCYVEVVDNGQEVLSALKKQDFDCILMDIQMPILDGVEATRQIRNKEVESSKDKSEKFTSGSSNSSMPKFQNPKIPIIALTAFAMTGDKEKFLAAGMDDYISKPINKDELKEVMERNLAA